MSVKIIELAGVYKDMEILQMENGRILEWSNLSDENFPLIPFGTEIKISLEFDDPEFLKGSDGVVWGTYSIFQAETIKNVLLIQNIFNEIKTTKWGSKNLYLIYVKNPKQTEVAINFIWRDDNGLKLKFDWSYPLGKENKSFNKWLSNT